MSQHITEHWEKVYSKTSNENRGWYQKIPLLSLEYLSLTGTLSGKKIIDVGGGTSHLAGSIDLNQTELTILDISIKAIQEQKILLKDHAKLIHWVVGDISKIELPNQYDIWHDRAVFHFLIDDTDKQSYIKRLNKYLNPGGWLIIATFLPTGPEKCSGLPVHRYSPELLSKTIGENFSLKKSDEYRHLTPSGKEQNYIYCLFSKEV